MSGLYDLRGQSCETEQDLVRQTVDAKNALRATVEREQRIIAEKRGQLEAEMEASEAKLQTLKEQAQGLQGEVEQRQQEAPSVTERLPELEEARAAVEEAKSQLVAARQKGTEETAAHQARLDEARGIYQMYAASTGIRWDFDAESVKGHVALGSAKHFDLGPEVTVTGVDAEADGPEKRAQLAEKLWTEVEAALPPPSNKNGPPWEISPDSPAGKAGA